MKAPLRTVEVPCGDGAYMSIPKRDVDTSLEWVARYGDVHGERYVLASVVASYAYLLTDDIPTREAIRRLRLLRRAYAGDQDKFLQEMMRDY